MTCVLDVSIECGIFRGVKDRADLGKALHWPVPPAVLSSFQQKLQLVHSRWRAGVILGRMPSHLRASLLPKIAAYESLNGKRQWWGYHRYWKGDYLTHVSYFSRLLKMWFNSPLLRGVLE